MFKFIAARKADRNYRNEQQKLDCLRYLNADNPLMQLHCDRMQTALDATR